MEFKDYYKILGVSRDASADDIRKAFRKLARQYHPDVAKSKSGAEDKFKEINEANEVLSDPEKRKKYDTLGADWNRPQPQPGQGRGFRGQGRPGQAPGQDFSFDGTGFSDFFEQMFGGGRGGGGGRYSQGAPDSEMFSPGHDVEADILVTLEEAFHGAERSITLRHPMTCSECKGKGIKGKATCKTCEGTGQVTGTETSRVRIPAGIRDGQQLRVAGKGGRGTNGSQGDLYLRVRLAAHPDFRIENGVLVHDLELWPWEATLGGEKSFKALDGQLTIRVPAGIQPGTKLRVKGRGLPQAGDVRADLFVEIQVKVPTTLSAEARKLWEQLGKTPAD